MAPEQTESKRKLPGRIKILLFASLALNLVIVGVVVGAIMRFGSEHGQRLHRDPMIRALSVEHREEVGRSLRAGVGMDRRAFRSALGRAHETMIAALEADPFEVTALEAAMAEKSRLMRDRRAAGEAALVEVITRMSAEERRGFAQRLREMQERWRGKADGRAD